MDVDRVFVKCLVCVEFWSRFRELVGRSFVCIVAGVRFIFVYFLWFLVYWIRAVVFSLGSFVVILVFFFRRENFCFIVLGRERVFSNIVLYFSFIRCFGFLYFFRVSFFGFLLVYLLKS